MWQVAPRAQLELVDSEYGLLSERMNANVVCRVREFVVSGVEAFGICDVSESKKCKRHSMNLATYESSYHLNKIQHLSLCTKLYITNFACNPMRTKFSEAERWRYSSK
jgi:hypothetical protein